ncbi:major type 1 subunit fimbrin (pilin) [Buttiauxella sp. BIGb0552]|nr:major type 1 subunit fimbrin (pilin) [Buttiauxella sp. BIGb0552]
MKKLNFAYAAVVMAIAFGQQAMASDGTINFTGKVTDVTCTVTATSSSGSNVTLPTVSKTALANIHDTAGATPFKISLTGCTGSLADPVNVAVYFEPGGNVNTDGRLNNTAVAGAAQNVDIALSLADKVSEELNLGVSPTVKYATIDPDDKNAEMNFVAKYYATGAAEAGAVTSSVTYSIVYP